MVSEDLTLQEIINTPEIQARGYMLDPGVDDLLKVILGEDYNTLLEGKTFLDLRLKDISRIMPSWNIPSLVAGMEYLLEKAKAGTVFYDIWDEKSMMEEPSRKQTGLCAFTLPEKKKFVLICPGGGYESVCAVAEGYGIAKELNEIGYAAFILRYRVGEDIRQPKHLEDLAQAIKYIFANAEELNVDIDNYALMGFSAGAHLAGCFGIEKIGYKKYALARPSAIILGYPVITMGEKAHEGSREALLGKENVGNESLKNLYSIEMQITNTYPHVYVWQCEKDDTVPIENSRMLAAALKDNHVQYEYEVFPGNAHGWGAGTGTEAEGWIERAVAFWDKM